ncbi:sulfatase-like hydrolase/transferase [Catenovulum sediminis]|uniref:sulfatase-like hydrolase/transferase n=1 Tax=Catenovulum sediminis TaxID=1740262 RepID=UPI00117C5B8E|nr:sulfatase-like hydrolase/transferase [Catenovulum sediminis]
MRLLNKRPVNFTAGLIACVLTACSQTTTENSTQFDTKTEKPNIVIFYVDDLGYADLSSYGAIGVKTPNVDRLAENGVRFTDGHSSAATCTPSRYSLLTGEYAFRKKAQVLKGDAALLIDPAQPTLPSMLKKAGYTSAVVGKWHLGLGDGTKPIDWNSEIKPGPLEIGFDYSFLLPATGDRVPAVYMENHKVINLSANDPLYVDYTKKIGDRPTGYENPELRRQVADDQHNKTIINGISRIGWMQGGKSAEWKDEDFYTVFTDKANQFIEDNKNNPFFLFFSFHDIHVPRLPHERFIGKSEMGLRGDAIVQMDYITGQVINKLEQAGILDNTLVIFTSDNGPVLNDGYEDQAVELLGQHQPGGVYRGGKYSAYEAGTRVPTIVHYPNRVKPAVSNALMSQVDIYASVANLLGIELAENEAIDSQNHIAAWLDGSVSGREELIEEAFTLSLRQGDWKYISPSTNKDGWIRDKGIESGLINVPQLYDLSKDPSERHNIAALHPQRVKQMQQRIEQLVAKTQR